MGVAEHDFLSVRVDRILMECRHLALCQMCDALRVGPVVPVGNGGERRLVFDGGCLGRRGERMDGQGAEQGKEALLDGHRVSKVCAGIVRSKAWGRTGKDLPENHRGTSVMPVRQGKTQTRVLMPDS